MGSKIIVFFVYIIFALAIFFFGGSDATAPAVSSVSSVKPYNVDDELAVLKSELSDAKNALEELRGSIPAVTSFDDSVLNKKVADIFDKITLLSGRIGLLEGRIDSIVNVSTTSTTSVASTSTTSTVPVSTTTTTVKDVKK